MLEDLDSPETGRHYAEIAGCEQSDAGGAAGPEDCRSVEAVRRFAGSADAAAETRCQGTFGGRVLLRLAKTVR